MCEEFFEYGCLDNRELARNWMCEIAVHGKVHGSAVSPSMHTVHMCKNGAIGLADFIGFK
jgi:hypothetical protein